MLFRCFSFSFIIISPQSHRTGVRTPKFAAVVTIVYFTLYFFCAQNEIQQNKREELCGVGHGDAGAAHLHSQQVPQQVLGRQILVHQGHLRNVLCLVHLDVDFVC